MSETLASQYATTPPGDSGTPVTLAPPLAEAPRKAASSDSARFEVLRPHASGGLGQVSVALDKELHRQVAIKEIHPRLADHPESRARFLLEAEVTGGLEHPGVVPVYSLGQWCDGRPFYAMRLIRGESLEDAVRRFHGDDCDMGERELRLRRLLRRFIDVCNAIDYAHSRGVLHRDLKPSNIMLGPYGETLVVDWGLAKTAARPGETPTAAESLFAPPAAGDTPATRVGSAVGTPAYMSPEQAAGALDLLGPASDVYSLGATLYTILTSRPPFIGDDFAVVRGLILKGVFPEPRDLRPEIPRALEAVCLKAMALEPGQRYPSARALAEDIEKWLGDANVSAYQEGWTERGARWLRRHRTWAVSGVVSLVVITVVAISASLLINRARLQTEVAQQQRLLSQIDLLCNAEPAAIPLILGNLRPYHNEVAPRLRAMLDRNDLRPYERMRLGLALLGDEPRLLDDLVTALLTCPHDDFPVLRDLLRPKAEAFVDRLWQTLGDAGSDAAVRFRAGLALARYAAGSDRWTSGDETFMARTLLTKGIERQRELRADLQPMAARLLPEIFSAFRDPAQHSEVRSSATAALADWAAGEPRLLATAVCEATHEQFLVLLAALSSAERAEVVATLRQIIRRQPPLDDSFTESDRVSLGRRRAAAVIALLRLNEDPLLAQAFTPAADPESQTQFTTGARARGVAANQLVAILQTATSEAVRFGLLLALGEYPLHELAEPTRGDFVAQLDEWYRTDGSSAIHAACGWLLRTWHQSDRVHAFDASPQSADFDPQRQWFVVQVGRPVRPGMTLTMISFPPGEFLMGSPPTERDRQVQETQHRVKLTRPFAMSERTLSGALYVRFLEEVHGPESVKKYLAAVRETVPTPKHPAVGVSWYDAVLFARWLTAEVGLSESDQCYADPATLALDSHGHPIDRQWPFYPERKGFRLPTESEWEYACRSGTVTTFAFGSDPTVADDYGWFQGNSSGSLQPTSPLKPAGRGLISMHGNAAEWCHDWYGFTPGGRERDPVGVSEGSCRTIRSGSYLSGLTLSRSASRAGLPPEFAAPCAGLRLVRTLIP